jgi:hypothetical protein
MAETKRKRFDILRTQLINERQSFEPHWKTIADHVLPTRARFQLTDANRGDRRNLKIINSTATLASRTLRSGMMAGITSPARPWFKLTVPDRALAEYQPVRMWLQIVEKEISRQFLMSNLYNALPTLYGDMGNFATAAMFMEEDMETVSRFYVFPIGSYYIANDEKLRVRTFMREFRMTVRQVVNKFGRDFNGNIDWSNISDRVKNMWDRGHYETWVDVCHIVKPNEEYDPKKLESKYKRFSSVYYELGVQSGGDTNYITGRDIDKLLSEKGYNYFPVLAPRWEVVGEDVYGSDCPGMTALGDNKSLQTMEKRKAQAVEKKVSPPMTAPSMLRNQKASILPGDITFVDIREGQQGFRPAHEVNFNLSELYQDIQDQQQRISRAYYEDLFLMLARSDRREITAREIDERHEEKLLMLGPVLEGLNQDLLDPLIDNQFQFGLEQGRFPPPPPELSEVDLKIEYVSIMAQAQKLAGISNIERFVGFAVNIATQTQDPTKLDKVDFDQAIDVYGERMGVDVDIIRSDEDVEAMRAQRTEGQQAQTAMEGIAEMAGAAKNLSGAKLEEDRALKRLVDGGK